LMDAELMDADTYEKWTLNVMKKLMH